MHGDWLADDEAICDELADGLTGVGVRDLVHFVRVQPDLALATVGDGRRQTLLGAKVDPAENVLSVSGAMGRVGIVMRGRGCRPRVGEMGDTKR